MKHNHWLYISVLIIFTLGCSTAKKEQLPAPHNNYTGLTVDAYFSGDGTVTSEMMRACSKYGGLDQSSINNSGDDLILQDIISYQCNFANRSSDEITIDGKSVKGYLEVLLRKNAKSLAFR